MVHPATFYFLILYFSSCFVYVFVVYFNYHWIIRQLISSYFSSFFNLRPIFLIIEKIHLTLVTSWAIGYLFLSAFLSHVLAMHTCFASQHSNSILPSWFPLTVLNPPQTPGNPSVFLPTCLLRSPIPIISSLMWLVLHSFNISSLKSFHFVRHITMPFSPPLLQKL